MTNFGTRAILAALPYRRGEGLLRVATALETVQVDKDGVRRVGQKLLAELAGVSNTTMRRARADMIRIGMISYRPGGGAGKKSEYRWLTDLETPPHSGTLFADQKPRHSGQERVPLPLQKGATGKSDIRSVEPGQDANLAVLRESPELVPKGTELGAASPPELEAQEKPAEPVADAPGKPAPKKEDEVPPKEKVQPEAGARKNPWANRPFKTPAEVAAEARAEDGHAIPPPPCAQDADLSDGEDFVPSSVPPVTEPEPPDDPKPWPDREDIPMPDAPSAEYESWQEWVPAAANGSKPGETFSIAGEIARPPAGKGARPGRILCRWCGLDVLVLAIGAHELRCDKNPDAESPW